MGHELHLVAYDLAAGGSRPRVRMPERGMGAYPKPVECAIGFP
jgi:hypothetical protein